MTVSRNAPECASQASQQLFADETRPFTPVSHPVVTDPAMPGAEGMYDPRMEKDSCGVGFVADM